MLNAWRNLNENAFIDLFWISMSLCNANAAMQYISRKRLESKPIILPIQKFRHIDTPNNAWYKNTGIYTVS